MPIDSLFSRYFPVPFGKNAPISRVFPRFFGFSRGWFFLLLNEVNLEFQLRCGSNTLQTGPPLKEHNIRRIGIGPVRLIIPT
jgi:hypothetical protein